MILLAMKRSHCLKVFTLPHDVPLDGVMGHFAQSCGIFLSRRAFIGLMSSWAWGCNA